MTGEHFFYVLEEDNATRLLATAPPPWGQTIPSLPAGGAFQMTHWRHLVPVLIHRLARHSGRTWQLSAASCCVVASPPFGSIAAGRDCNRADWERLCPGKPIVAMDGPDADGKRDSLCAPLWRRCRESGPRDAIVRVSGSPPGLVDIDGTRSLCRRLDVPYLGHARLPLAAARRAERTTRIAYAGAVWGHLDSEAMGFNAWRRAIRDECRRQHDKDSNSCKWSWVSMRGSGAPAALTLYAASTFCLQPPGDTISRSGIVDAVTLGCIPVFFHPQQRELWTDHWRAAEASVLFDWTPAAWAEGAPQPLVKDPAVYAARAAAMMAELIAMPAERVAALREAVARAAPALVYAASEGGGQAGGTRGASADAVDHLVARMRALRLEPSTEEQARYEQQLARRAADRVAHKARRAEHSAWLATRNDTLGKRGKERSPKAKRLERRPKG